MARLHPDLRCQTLLPGVPAARQQFFKSHILVQSAIHRYSVEMMSHLANATLVLAASPTPGTAAVATAAASVDAAWGGLGVTVGLFRSIVLYLLRRVAMSASC